MPLSTGSSETGDLRPARASSDDEDDEDDHHLEIQEASRGDVAEAARLLGRQGSGETIPADAAAALVQIHRENLALVDAGDRRPIARPRSWARKVFAGLLADPAQVRDALGRRGKLLEEAARARDERHKTLERSDARLRARNAALDEVSSWSGEERIRQARALKLPPAQIPMLERDEPPGFVLEELADLWLASGATTGGRSASGQPREGPSEAPGEPIGTPGGGAGVSAAVRGLAGSKSAPTVRRHKRPKRRR